MTEKRTLAIRLNWRPAIASDVSDCLRVSPKISGEEVLGKTRAHSAWQDLTSQPAFQSALIETEQPVLGSRVVGFGSSVFVQDAFARDEIEQPRPGVAQRILCRVAESRPTLLSQREIKRDNTLQGLNVIILSADVRPDLATQFAWTERIQPLLANAFLACQSGYRLRRILLEVTDPTLRQRVETMQMWNLREHEAQGHVFSYASALAVMERSDALRQRESLSAMLFNYQEPRLRFAPAEQDLLLAALTGCPDREISQSLGVSKETIKTRWLAALRKAEDALPEIFGRGMAERNDQVGRGPQRRHHLMQFLRMHPEELRPFDWASNTKPHRRLEKSRT